MTTDTPVNEMTFEQAMSELETVLRQLEQGDVALDDSIKLYERGAALKARCEAKLKEAEEKVAAGRTKDHRNGSRWKVPEGRADRVGGPVTLRSCRPATCPAPPRPATSPVPLAPFEARGRFPLRRREWVCAVARRLP